jgi:hypothetical protein
MKKTRFIILLAISLTSMQACQKNKDGQDFIFEGKVVNAGSKKPIDSVRVVLHGGFPYRNFLAPDLHDNPPTGNNDTTYTNENGRFKVAVYNESTVFLSWYKKGYHDGTIIREESDSKGYANADNSFFQPCDREITIEYEADCSFEPILKKKENSFANDTLVAHFDGDYWEKPRLIITPFEIYYGKGPFEFKYDNFPGDIFVHYKLEFTNNGTWDTIIDSVFVKSFTTYEDTIYY